MQAYFDRDSVDLLPVPADGVVNDGDTGYHGDPNFPDTSYPYYTELGIIPRAATLRTAAFTPHRLRRNFR